MKIGDLVYDKLENKHGVVVDFTTSIRTPFRPKQEWVEVLFESGIHLSAEMDLEIVNESR